ncbi:MAG: PD40 domain-containing protein [Elusimicrobiales bacterium]|nr:PD40 domain-containing protein [Elusimicrobiales bacterium]
MKIRNIKTSLNLPKAAPIIITVIFSACAVNNIFKLPGQYPRDFPKLIHLTEEIKDIQNTPVWSPDGKTIVFCRHIRLTNIELFMTPMIHESPDEDILKKSALTKFWMIYGMRDETDKFKLH